MLPYLELTAKKFYARNPILVKMKLDVPRMNTQIDRLEWLQTGSWSFNDYYLTETGFRKLCPKLWK